MTMKLFDKYFQPYAEYCIRTTLSEDELKEALAQECPATSDVLSWKAVKAVFGLSKTIVFSCDPDIHKNNLTKEGALKSSINKKEATLNSSKVLIT